MYEIKQNTFQTTDYVNNYFRDFLIKKKHSLMPSVYKFSLFISNKQMICYRLWLALLFLFVYANLYL